MVSNKNKKQKRLDKYIEKQLKKEERVKLYEQLSTTAFSSDLLNSTRTLGQKSNTKKTYKGKESANKSTNAEVEISPKTDETATPELTSSATAVRHLSRKTIRKKNKRLLKKSQNLLQDLNQNHDLQALDTLTTKLNTLPTTTSQANKTTNPILNQNSDSASTKTTTTTSTEINVPQKAKPQPPLSVKVELQEKTQAPVASITKRKRKKSNRVLDKLGWAKKNKHAISDDDSEADPEQYVDLYNNENQIGSQSESESESESDVEAEVGNINNPEPEEDDSSDQESPDLSSQIAITNGSGLKNQKEETIFTGSKLKHHIQISSSGTNVANDASEAVKPKYVFIKRTPHVQRQRLQLPIVAEEQQIMEAIKENLVTLLVGATGSGKTTQLPQFLYESGYAGFSSEEIRSKKIDDTQDQDFGIIGVTQPRRVAAISMAKRVAYEMGTLSPTEEDSTAHSNSNDSAPIVSYQIRFDNKTSKSTKIKFMTDGVLLRELCNDFLLNRYSVIILDEVHERSLNTDILVGVLSRIVKLRQDMFNKKETIIMSSDSSVRGNVQPLTRKVVVKPLKLVIMSATMMVDDFAKNSRLFNPQPQVINVESRQYPVCIRFSKKTPVGEGAYVKAAIKKTAQIHERLPEGGILVFLTGQMEINYFCKEIAEKYKNVTTLSEDGETLESKANPSKKKSASAPQDHLIAGNEVTNIMMQTESAKNISIEAEDMEYGVPGSFQPDNDSDDLFSLKPKQANKKSKTSKKQASATTAISLSKDKHISDPQRDDFEEGEKKSLELEKKKEEEDEEDDEEEEIWLFGNNKDDIPPLKSNLDPSQQEIKKVYVLPLYSTLDPKQQAKVFEQVPPNHRLIVAATNVAETSITIPGIKYVIDSGKVKDKKYDIRTGTIKYDVDWTSQASADQRAGRAGRVSAGYCYRLYSSSVFSNFFPKFNEPEVNRMPIEQVILMMKSNHINNIENFPFISQPKQESITKALELLKHLGALDNNFSAKVTDVGHLMMLFPVAPRFAKMILLGHQYNCLSYVIAIVSLLSIGDPFRADNMLDKDDIQQEVGSIDQAFDTIDQENGQDSGISQARKRFFQTMGKLAQQNPTSDFLKWLSVVGAYEYSDLGREKKKICQRFFLREKNMSDCSKLINQLAYICYRELSDIVSFERIVHSLKTPPSDEQKTVLRQIICNAYVDQVAIRYDLVPNNNVDDDENDDGTVGYFIMGSSDLAFIHPSSVVLINKPNSKSSKNKKSRKAHLFPKYLVYGELQQTSKLWMKQITEIQPSWLVSLARSFITFGKPLQHPIPTYNQDKTIMTCSVSASFGKKSWPLPDVMVEQKRTGTRWKIHKVLG